MPSIASKTTGSHGEMDDFLKDGVRSVAGGRVRAVTAIRVVPSAEDHSTDE
jgi:hypothetical protein